MIIGSFILQYLWECSVQIELIEGHFELQEAIHKKCAFECVNYSWITILNVGSCQAYRNNSVIISAEDKYFFL